MLQKLEFSCEIARRLAYFYFLFMLLLSFMDSYGALQYMPIKLFMAVAFPLKHAVHFSFKNSLCMPVNSSTVK